MNHKLANNETFNITKGNSTTDVLDLLEKLSVFIPYIEILSEICMPQPPYEEQYFTTVALGTGTFTFTMSSKLSTAAVPYMSYSIDNGETWVRTNNIDNQEVTITTPTILAGKSVLWKSESVQFYINPDPYPGGNHGYGKFTSTNFFNVCGNIMSLIYGDNFVGETTLKTLISTGLYAGSFYSLLSGCKIASASKLILPATTVSTNCYRSMFSGCTSLTSAPELPATGLNYYCYMTMFDGCTSLTTAPELPATTLVGSCYNAMFSGCTSLTSAPELPATALAQGCYQNIFNNCSKLNYIKAMFTTTPSTSYTGGWVNGVATTGTFVKNSAANWNVSGVNGIPLGWTVQTASA